MAYIYIIQNLEQDTSSEFLKDLNENVIQVSYNIKNDCRSYIFVNENINSILISCKGRKTYICSSYSIRNVFRLQEFNGFMA